MKTPEYRSQDRLHNCGPYAALNTLLWMGHKRRNLDLYRIENLLQTDETWGTHKYRVTNFLKQLGIKFTEKRRVKIKDLDKALSNGKGVIYLYMHNRDIGHYIFLYGRTEKCFLVANDISKYNKPQMRRSKKFYGMCAQKYSKTYRDRFFGVYPHAWFIERDKND